MKTTIVRLTTTVLLTLLVAACASTPTYQSMQSRLQQQMSTIASLDQKLASTQDPTMRQQLRAQKRQALQEGITLLNQAQASNLEANRACMAREKNLPSSSQTCFEEESLEEAQSRMMTLVLHGLLAADSSQ